MKSASFTVLPLLSFGLGLVTMGKLISGAPIFDHNPMQPSGTTGRGTEVTSRSTTLKQDDASLEPETSHANIMPCSSAWKAGMGHGPVCYPTQKSPPALPNPDFGLGP
ncbi:hypothetical protein BGZ68_001338 [Mortierella alpina]|nr:hypothetical protein BGZ68_001338 [Mortierella alpina]